MKPNICNNDKFALSYNLIDVLLYYRAQSDFFRLVFQIFGLRKCVFGDNVFISKDLIEVAFRLGEKNFLKYIVLCVTIISQFYV
jgi:hypothetical protein